MGHTSWLGWSESGFEFGGWDSQASALTLPALHVGGQHSVLAHASTVRRESLPHSQKGSVEEHGDLFLPLDPLLGVLSLAEARTSSVGGAGHSIRSGQVDSRGVRGSNSGM